MIKTDLLQIANLPHRNNKAEKYSATVSKKNKKCFARNLIGIGILSALLITIAIPGKTYSYYTKDNGLVTEYKTKIHSVDLENNIVYVEYKNNIYGYYADGEIDTTEKITVVFNYKMDIIDTY